jgi:acyl-CoA synthetase (AMP-forming)/AMP-acid ligase II
MTNLYAYVERACAQAPNAPAVVYVDADRPHVVLTYSELVRCVGVCASALNIHDLHDRTVCVRRRSPLNTIVSLLAYERFSPLPTLPINFVLVQSEQMRCGIFLLSTELWRCRIGVRG